MNNEFIPYEQALALKELGFDDNCIGFYNAEQQLRPVSQKSHRPYSRIMRNISLRSNAKCTALLYQQAFRWFRENYNLHYSIKPFYYSETATIRFRWDCYEFIYHEVPNRRTFKSFGSGESTREEAELECLKKLIEIVKENGKSENS